MVFRESLSISLAALAGHKLRTALTMLGIIFGVAAVIAMLSIGAGAKKETLDQIRLMGVNNVIIRSSPVVQEKTERGRVVEASGLKLDDVGALRLLNPLVSAAVPQRELADMTLSRGSRRITATVVGTLPEYQVALHFRPEKGGFFNYRDNQEARKVAVLGHDAAQELFWIDPPVGGEIKIGEDWYTVIGVMEPKPRSAGKGGADDRDLNRDVYIPLMSAMRRFVQKTDSEIDRVILTVKEESRIREAATLAGRFLALRHRAEDYRIVVPEELIRQSQKTQRIFNIVMGAIAGISLLVGGIGIMNIMLATVFERTREIGIRRAVGATRKEILGQFLIEAVILSVAGGLIGVAIGVGLTRVITLYAGWKTIVEFGSIVLAFGVSAAVGIAFGIYPARKAAGLDPIESLRYE